MQSGLINWGDLGHRSLKTNAQLCQASLRGLGREEEVRKEGQVG